MRSEKDSEGSEFSYPERREMPFTAAAVAEELSAKVKDAVASEPEGSVKARLRAAARRIGLPIGRIQDYLYGEVRCPPAHEADRIRAYYKAAQKLLEARHAYEQRRQDILRNNPNLARFVPGPLAVDGITAEAEAATRSELARHRR